MRKKKFPRILLRDSRSLPYQPCRLETLTRVDSTDAVFQTQNSLRTTAALISADASTRDSKLQQASKTDEMLRTDHAQRTKNSPSCYFFPQGRCLKGFSCRFAHKSQESASSGARDEQERHALRTKAAPQCCYFMLDGGCRYGYKCRFSHEVSNSTTTSGKDGSSNKEQPGTGGCCSICLESPSDSKFALMESCDHAFCVACIRRWRSPSSNGAEAVVKQETRRSCPVCRRVSFFVVPSSRPLEGKDREAAITSYKAFCSKKRCKHFKSDGCVIGSCPFGHKCFFAHVNADGTDCKMEEKRRFEERKRNKRASALRREEQTRAGIGDILDADLAAFFFGLENATFISNISDDARDDVWEW